MWTPRRFGIGSPPGESSFPRNRKRREIRPVAVGEGLTIKVNANIGSSRDHADISLEMEKMRAAVACGADAVMDLSTGGPIDAIRRAILAECPVPIGTVPLYQIAADGNSRGKSWVELTADDFFAGIEKQAIEGVDFMTVHCGVTRASVERLVREGRRLDIVSRGGSLLAEWMDFNGLENPFYDQYDRLLAICREFDITISLGDGLRPGCVADATDRAQVYELMTLGELTERAWAKDVQVMVEGPGHVPMHQIAANMVLQKRLCHGAPFYVLGPLVTDIAPGYDHITSAIGGAIAGWNGADFLCYVTPSEHLRLPPVEDVREGVIATRIAAHAADIARGIPGAMDWDNKMADARGALDWKAQIELSIDPERASAWRGEAFPPRTNRPARCARTCAPSRRRGRRSGKGRTRRIHRYFAGRIACVFSRNDSANRSGKAATSRFPAAMAMGAAFDSRSSRASRGSRITSRNTIRIESSAPFSSPVAIPASRSDPDNFDFRTRSSISPPISRTARYTARKTTA